MADYIDKEKALSFPFANGQYDKENANENFILGCETYKEWLESLPEEDVTPIKHGKWILHIAGFPEYDDPVNEYQCSCCGYGDVFSPNKNVPYCWHCGAKMDGKKEKGVFINIPDIGDLYIYDVLVSYVCPVSFVCIDEYDTKYLFYEITDEKDYIEWLVSKITNKEYYSIIDKKIPIQNGFKKSGFLRKVKKTYEGGLVACEPIGKSELALLPVDDVFVEKKAVDGNIAKTAE